VDVSRVTSGRVSRAEWVGADGQMIADWVRHQVSKTSACSGLEEWPVEDCPTVVATLRAFLDALDRGAPMPITGLDGQRAVEIADACYQSADTGKTVRL
jgi:predicted dehydrogenase